MTVRLSITMADELCRRLKRELPPHGISAFIADAVRRRLGPGRRELDVAYAAAREEAWRRELADDWAGTDASGLSQ